MPENHSLDRQLSLSKRDCSLYNNTVDKLIVFCVYFDDNRDNGINRNNRINRINEGNGGCHEVT